MPALIFDCDGVLADTERDGHLPAFNQTFREFGLPQYLLPSLLFVNICLFLTPAGLSWFERGQF